MNLREVAIELRPRSLSEVIDLALRVCVVRRRLYVRLALLVLLPGLATCAALRWLADMPWWGVWLVALVFSAVTEGVFTVAAGLVLFKEELPAGEVLRRFGRRFRPYVTSLVATRLLRIVSSPTIALFPILQARWFLVGETALLEGTSAREAIARSARLTDLHRGAALGFAVWLFAAQLVAVTFAELVGQAVVGQVLQLGAPVGRLLSDGGSLFALGGLLAVVPVVATARFLKYVDLRTRREGWDIQLRFTALREAEERRRMAA